MFNVESFSTGATRIPQYWVSLMRPICAIQTSVDESGGGKLGLLVQLETGTTIQVCGEGFNERTVKVNANGRFYFVFLQDIEK